MTGSVVYTAALSGFSSEPRSDGMVGEVDGADADRSRLFRNIALPHLDEVYTLARYLLRDPTDAEDAVQECYLRALKHFDTFRGVEIKPWLFAILRNVCQAEFARRSAKVLHIGDTDTNEADDAAPLWREAQESPETELTRRQDSEAIRRFVAALPEQFREVIVLREINGLSYREIADVVRAPIGTVMSRLARARAMLSEAWSTEEERLSS
jgi:RNA polymerase sigma-70 factor, ECF subfamily